MLSFRASLAFLLSASVLAVTAFATPTHKKTTTAQARTGTHHSSKSASSRSGKSARSVKATAKSRHKKLHGQQSIDSARVTEIQQALIRQHYMTGEANGQWDSNTIAAMQKFQSDQGWQTKLMPDSRAIKMLGLGPDYSDAINASGSSFASPKPASDIPAAQTQGFASASGVNQ